MGQDRIIKVTHDGRGTMDIDKISGDRLHVFEDGGAHIDKADGRKLKIEKLTGEGFIKDLGPYF